MKPVFMFGFERSGTTLLSMVVGAHPEIAVPLSVTGLWLRYAKRLAHYDALRNTAAIERMVDDLLDEERISLLDAEFSKTEILRDLPVGDYGAVVARFHERYASQHDKPYWANLDIATLDGIAEVNRWFPDAKFIHIVRDGRDVALSHETMPYGTSNTLECAMHWSRRLAMNLMAGEIMGDRYHLIRYEDLLLDTENTLVGLCRFMGVPFSEGMLDYGRMVEVKVPDSKRWLWPDLEKPLVQSNAYRWRTKMSRSSRIVFESEAGEMLKRLGYEIWAKPPKSVLAYLRELFWFAGRGGRFARIRKRLGMDGRSKLEKGSEHG